MRKPQAIIDTCVLLSILLKEKDRCEASKRLLEDIGTQNVALPATCAVEFYANSSIRQAKSMKIKERMGAYHKALGFMRNLGITFVEVSPAITDEASRMCAAYNIKAMDSIVLATAKCLGISTVYTYDDKLIRAVENAKETVQFQIERPPTPADLGQLDLYREE